MLRGLFILSSNIVALWIIFDQFSSDGTYIESPEYDEYREEYKRTKDMPDCCQIALPITLKSSKFSSREHYLTVDWDDSNACVQQGFVGSVDLYNPDSKNFTVTGSSNFKQTIYIQDDDDTSLAMIKLKRVVVSSSNCRYSILVEKVWFMSDELFHSYIVGFSLFWVPISLVCYILNLISFGGEQSEHTYRKVYNSRGSGKSYQRYQACRTDSEDEKKRS